MVKQGLFRIILVLTLGAGIISSCGHDSTFRGFEFMPDMYRGPAVETYQPIGEEGDSMSAREPVEGTIPRGFFIYDSYDAGQSGYDSAKANLKMPADFPKDSVTLYEGAELYRIFCSHCHGDNGNGQGILVQREKILGVPSYDAREINMGTIFHVVTYGKGIMGSHASQVTPEERWKIAQHVMKLRAGLISGETDEPQDTVRLSNTVPEVSEEDEN